MQILTPQLKRMIKIELIGFSLIILFSIQFFFTTPILYNYAESHQGFMILFKIYGYIVPVIGLSIIVIWMVKGMTKKVIQ